MLLVVSSHFLKHSYWHYNWSGLSFTGIHITWLNDMFIRYRNNNKLYVSFLHRKEGSSFLRYLEIGNCSILCSFLATFFITMNYFGDILVYMLVIHVLRTVKLGERQRKALVSS